MGASPYDYIIFFDTDSEFPAHSSTSNTPDFLLDSLSAMHASNDVYAYVHRTREKDSMIAFMWDYTKLYIAQKKLPIPDEDVDSVALMQDTPPEYAVSDGVLSGYPPADARLHAELTAQSRLETMVHNHTKLWRWNRHVYMTDLEIMRADWFRAGAAWDYFEYIDSLEGWYTERWGDHAFRTLQLKLLLKPKEFGFDPATGKSLKPARSSQGENLDLVQGVLRLENFPYAHQRFCQCGGGGNLGKFKCAGSSGEPGRKCVET